MVDTGAATSPFSENSYFFGTNIPGKPRKYLLNSGGRPKLLTEIGGSRRTATRLSSCRAHPTPPRRP